MVAPETEAKEAPEKLVFWLHPFLIVLTNLENSLLYISVANEMKDGPQQQQQVMYQPGSVEAQMAVINEAYSADPPVVTIIRLKDWMSLEMALFIRPYLSFPVCFLLIIITQIKFQTLILNLFAFNFEWVIHSLFIFWSAISFDTLDLWSN